MRILYLCPDPGVRVDVDGGAGSHVLETIRALRSLGHDVRLLAADGGIRSVDGLRVPRHRWFSGLISLTGRGPTPAKIPASPPSAPAEVTIPSPSRSPATAAPAPTEQDGIRQRLSGFLHGPLRHRINLLEENTAYRRRFFQTASVMIRDFQPDGVYERHALGHYAVATHCGQAGIPHILEVNALLAEERSRHEGGAGFFSRWRQWEERRFLGRCPRVFVVSDALKRAIGPDDPHVAVLPNGVDTAIFRPDVDPGPIRQRYGLAEAPVVGWIGGFGPSRGLEAVFAIAEAVHRWRPEVRFLVAGDGPLMAWARETVRKAGLEGIVHLTGRVARPEVPALIAAFDVALAPYPTEGAAYFSPLKIFEYMASARAVLATDAGQSSELLANGIGILLPTDAADHWADRVVALLDDPGERLRMGMAARERVIRKYTWEANARRIVAVFSSFGRRP